ncbi:hypothetical protein [Micromonospora cathayae]|uniref:Uncharacterized protein n=1 Tax=Micromonospora cathayae TaxID=3028804 RepID=A0ABY7ZRK9_9ACTN|nr:hypothetical protein [Micromonospora sp. HUAS 3]WDZ84698.1 hypothetical protein PVK37_30455 [Micromonospora sp. HUAS 3]
MDHYQNPAVPGEFVEQGLRKPSRPLLLDLLDAVHVGGVSFNDLADWYEYRPVTTIGPAAYRSIHE